MKQFRRILPVFLLLVLLTGCAFSGAEELYSLPHRSDVYLELERAIDGVMRDASYTAPLSGANRRSVQTADLDGDGLDEVLVFARTEETERPLRIFIFHQVENDFRLTGTIELDGAAFDSVQYLQIDGNPGMELAVSSRLSSKGLRSLGVYSAAEGEMSELLRTGCVSYTSTDLNGDALADIIVFSDTADSSNGLVEYYRWREDTLWRSGEAGLSVSAESVKRIITGNVAESVPAVFVASTYDASNIITDVFVAPQDGVFENIVYQTGEEELSTSTVRSYYVYSTDIDNDGVIELPQTEPLPALPNDAASREQYCVVWYNLLPDGSHAEKMVTYHNYDEGWYIELPSEWRPALSVTKREDGNLGPYTCLLVTDYVSRHELLRIYVLEASVATEALENGSVSLLARRGDTYYCVAPGLGIEIDFGSLEESFGFITTDLAS